MYGWLWNHLPGPAASKFCCAAVLLVAVVALLFTVVFPWVTPRLPFDDVTVDTTSAVSTTVNPWST